MSINVVLQENKFVAVDFTDCFLEFAMDENSKIMDMYHTFVHESGRGKGLAEKITLVAFKHCKQQNLQVKPSCSYISSRFLSKHPEFKDICV
jgi:predicted GNAT family acetyltransferase